ncbi:MAG TPA: GNAT family protein [Ferrovibrio sp.]|uniref:GNAT family N-acetyltransferase n=1 Tax=Ferrovibrio sp. TaxID=1917215 RepID=UPI002ED176ED
MNGKPLPAEIRPIREADAESYRACLDRVARERLYLAFTEAPSAAEAKFFIKAMVQRGLPFVVAVDPSDTVIGWCDIHVPPDNPLRPGFQHAGQLGMGLDESWRGKGLGTRMLQVCFDWAQRIGLERIELQVYASNSGAIALYRKFGFVTEGVRVRARKLDQHYDDIVIMARLRPPQANNGG